jgi:hypothetical protein
MGKQVNAGKASRFETEVKLVIGAKMGRRAAGVKPGPDAIEASTHYHWPF